ncbi:hypothetical protein SEA_SISKO_65 [Gordonia phage Sisko]|nr:hypothetical protein SEA_SISKO_65 [Gordonia phage Sisko]
MSAPRLPDPCSVDSQTGVETWDTDPVVCRRGQHIWVGGAEALMNSGEALDVAAALASAAQRAQAEHNAHAEVERMVTRPVEVMTDPIPRKRFDELTGTRPLPGQNGPGRVTPDTEAAAAQAARGEITHLVYEGEIVADVVNSSMEPVRQDRECIVCGTVFAAAEGHECRARILRGTGLF